jgi:oligogalacturonide lyase
MQVWRMTKRGFMQKRIFAAVVVLLCVAGLAHAQAPATRPAAMRDPNTGNTFQIDPNHAPLPREWIDKDTGHRVVRLTDEDGSASLYFHQNAYTPDGKKLIFKSPTGLYTVELATRKIEQVLPEPDISIIVAGRKTFSVYYMSGTASKDNASAPPRSVWRVDLNTREKKKIADLPKGSNISTVNCDETLLCGSITYPRPGETEIPEFRYAANGRIDIGYRRGLHLPMELMTINVASGETKFFNHSTEWLNHIQFSPTDPNLLMFCHEGPWQLVDRIWYIDVRGGEPQRVHDRQMRNEIAGHEFWSPDGQSIWYDLQTPIGQVFWLAGKNLKTGVRTWYPIQRSEWSVHYNVAPDGSLFAGDGGGPNSVAGAGHGQWIYAFRPQTGGRGGRGARANRANVPATNPARGRGAAPAPDTERDQSGLVVPGTLVAEKLVNLEKHDYALEPNVSFTPDMKWIVFRSNMLGPTHVYAVEIAKAQ